jgi:hypothetical protein
MRSTARLIMLRDRLELILRRFGTILFPQPLVDQNGRYHPALRSGALARASARFGDRWHTLRHLFAPSGEQDRHDSDVGAMAFASSDAPGTPPTKTPSAGRNAAA